MEWLFGRRMTPEEQLKKNQRALTKVSRIRSWSWRMSRKRSINRSMILILRQ